MHEASYVQLQYLFEMVSMVKPCFGTKARPPNIQMSMFVLIKKMFTQGLCLGSISRNGHHHNLYDIFLVRGSTEYFSAIV